jgi:hypothetical protein
MVKVMHKILGGMVLMMLLPFVCRAEETNIDALQYVGGTIPIIRRVEVSGPGYADFFSTVMADDYAAGFKASENGATTLTITANKAWKVLVRTMPFTKIEEYVKPASDLHLRIKDKTVVHEGEGNGGTLSETFTDSSQCSHGHFRYLYNYGYVHDMCAVKAKWQGVHICGEDLRCFLLTFSLNTVNWKS